MFIGTANDSGGENETAIGGGSRRGWREIDRDLRMLARRRSRVDSDEARLLCSVARLEVWREFGKASLLEYVEEVLGYGPRTASDRVRVALALDELPDLAEALHRGELPYSAVRELTRVATPATQRDWCDHARGKTLRQIEEKVALHKRGDRPSDRPSPELRPRVVRFEVRAATFALLRQVEQALAEERGSMLDDDALVAAMCNAVLAGGESTDAHARAKFQVVTVTCPSCDYTAQEAGGLRVPVGRADRARAECDAQRVSAAARTTQDVTPKKRQATFRRDGGKCCVPGCRASRYIEIHHIVPRAAGGSHDLTNLTLLCDGHHHALHDGKLIITGKAPTLTVRWARNPPPVRAHVGTAGDEAGLAADARKALVALQFSTQESRQAVATAIERVGLGGELEQIIREALRCLHPNTRDCARS